jgi:acyl-CoA thioesterase-2
VTVCRFEGTALARGGYGMSAAGAAGSAGNGQGAEMTVADLVGALDLELIGTHRYRADNAATHQSGGVVFGGQLLGQLAAAAALTEPAKEVKTVQAVFARAAVVAAPLEVEVEVIQSGRSFASQHLTVWQGDKVCARALALLSAPDPDLIRHAPARPEVGGPEAAEPLEDGFPGREVRILGGADPAGASPGRQMYAWIRFPDAPAAPGTTLGLLAHNTAAFTLAGAMRAHPELSTAGAHSSLSVGIMTQSVTFHQIAPPSEWILVAIESTYAGQGRTYGRGDLFTEEGTLVASYTQDGMVRQFDQAQAAKVPSTARI